MLLISQVNDIVGSVPDTPAVPAAERRKFATRDRGKFCNLKRRLLPLREPNFRRFYVGYVTSLLGTSLSSVAIAFAVLDSGGSATSLGLVFACGIIPQVAFLLHGGVIADRLGRRPVMLSADVLRCCAQAMLAAALLLGHPPIWLFAVLEAVIGTGSAFFQPALTSLTVEIAPADQLGNANAMLSLARSTTTVAGPALAGLLIATTSPAVAIAADAGSYAVSVLALAALRLAGTAAARGSMLGDLREGWAEFRGRDWLIATSVQFMLFNLVTWGPYLVLGPVLARQYLGGARAWGVIMSGYGAGAVLGGLLALGRKPRRPVRASAIASFGFAAPPLLLALHAPLPAIAAAALLAGAGSALGGAFQTTAIQQQVPADRLSRVSAIEVAGAYSFGPIAFVAAGPAAALVGARAVLGFGAAWAIACSLGVLAVPGVHRVTWRDEPKAGGGDPGGDQAGAPPR
jgi:predicted MFS family arabinose efflux permease